MNANRNIAKKYYEWKKKEIEKAKKEKKAE